MTWWLSLVSIVKDQVTVFQGHTSGGTVYLDGVVVGSVSTAQRITFTASLGKHIITLTCPGSSSTQCNQNTERIEITITEISTPPSPPGTGTNNNALIIIAGLAIAYLALKGKLK